MTKHAFIKHWQARLCWLLKWNWEAVGGHWIHTDEPAPGRPNRPSFYKIMWLHRYTNEVRWEVTEKVTRVSRSKRIKSREKLTEHW